MKLPKLFEKVELTHSSSVDYDLDIEAMIRDDSAMIPVYPMICTGGVSPFMDHVNIELESRKSRGNSRNPTLEENVLAGGDTLPIHN